MSGGTCEHCGASFRYRLIHNGFNETGYAYCGSCGAVAYKSAADKGMEVFRASTGWPGVLPPELIRTLPACACGGTFTAGAGPRCPVCTRPLSAHAAAGWVVPEAAPGWRWQRNWSGCYSVHVHPS